MVHKFVEAFERYNRAPYGHVQGIEVRTGRAVQSGCRRHARLAEVARSERQALKASIVSGLAESVAPREGARPPFICVACGLGVAVTAAARWTARPTPPNRAACVWMLGRT